MGEPDTTPAPQERTNAAPRKRGLDRWIRLGFLLVVIAAAVLIWRRQRSGAELEDWADDLPAAMDKARKDHRRVLAFFDSSPRSYDGEQMVRTTLGKADNRRAIREGGFLPVAVRTDSGLESDLAGRYRITRLPTMLILDADGRELNRREGFIGELPFRKGFLDLSEVQAPGG